MLLRAFEENWILRNAHAWQSARTLVSGDDARVEAVTLALHSSLLDLKYCAVIHCRYSYPFPSLLDFVSVLEDGYVDCHTEGGVDIAVVDYDDDHDGPYECCLAAGAVAGEAYEDHATSPDSNCLRGGKSEDEDFRTSRGDFPRPD